MDEREALPEEPSAGRVPQTWRGNEEEGIASHVVSRKPRITCRVCLLPIAYDSAVVLCMDGVGECATTSAWLGEGHTLTPLWEIPFPPSLGLLYSAFTYYTGFKVNSGEYKVMGLAPYGEPKYTKAIFEHLIDVKPDGTFRLNMEFFNYCTGLTMTRLC
jgi:predicted NodU family carbamoyl transferase